MSVIRDVWEGDLHRSPGKRRNRVRDAHQGKIQDLLQGIMIFEPGKGSKRGGRLNRPSLFLSKELLQISIKQS
jgi:hypothetical protein